jgi:hypothetical protein
VLERAVEVDVQVAGKYVADMAVQAPVRLDELACELYEAKDGVADAVDLMTRAGRKDGPRHGLEGHSVIDRRETSSGGA